MRLKLIVFLTLLSFAGALRADTITGTVTGVIGGPSTLYLTTDTYGLFGATGGNLAGDTLSLSYSYNTADFQNAAMICGTNCTYYGDSTLSPAETVSFTVNGQTQSYSPSLYSVVEFQNVTPSYPGNFFAEGVDAASGGRGVSAVLFSANNVSFGQPISPLADYVSNISFYTSNGYETLQFTPSTPSPAPEPSSIILVGAGLLGMAGVMKRRFFCDETRRSLH